MKNAKRTWRYFKAGLCLDLAGNAPLVVMGSGRSGTTWLAELCNYNDDFRYLFEPLNPDDSYHKSEVQRWCPHPDQSAPVIAKVLMGRQISPWSSRYNTKWLASRRLVKEIRLNLAVPWIRRNFPQAKLVKIVRNPMAVAASKKRLLQTSSSWVWNPSVDMLLAEDRVRSMLSDKQADRLRDYAGQGVALQAVADWCLQNMVCQEPVYTVFYESLLTHPEPALKDLFGYIGVNFHSRVLRSLNLGSTTQRKTRSEQSAQKAGWQAILTAQEQAAARTLLAEFDLGKLYTSDWEPAEARFA